MTSQATCPPSCSFYGAGCYAENHWLGKSWEKLTATGLAWEDFCRKVERLPEGQLWRHNQAGDLPGVGERIDIKAFMRLVIANEGKRGFTYTHKKSREAISAVRYANEHGFTVNLSCDSLEEVDRWRSDCPSLPLVVTINKDETRSTFETPAGHRVTVCPAQTRDEVTCASCKLCAVASRRAIVAFKAHGQNKRKVSELVQLGRKPDMKNGDIIKADGRAWKVLAVGATENGATYVHLASTLNGVSQKNGFRPVQVCGWLRDEKLEDRP